MHGVNGIRGQTEKIQIVLLVKYHIEGNEWSEE